ncbi:MAG: DegV family protein [Gemmatimonadota bacterium]|nr:DegV family protein [Gemmatimonadota bacterium]
MSGEVGLVTDSTAEIHALGPRTSWHVVPLALEMDGERYREGPELSAADFHQLLQEANSPPSTLPPSIEAFEEAYRELLGTYRRIVSVHLSGELSDTVEHAREAARRLGEVERIRVIDSMLAGPALGLLCLELEERIRSGRALPEAVSETEEIAGVACVYFSVYTLDFLYLGGRLERSPPSSASTQEDRPILTMRDGRLKLVERVIGETSRVERMAELVEERFGSDEPLAAAVVHAGVRGREAARRIEQRLLATPPDRAAAWRRAPLGPVLCAHTGFDVCGVAAYPLALSAL